MRIGSQKSRNRKSVKTSFFAFLYKTVTLRMHSFSISRKFNTEQEKWMKPQASLFVLFCLLFFSLLRISLHSSKEDLSWLSHQPQASEIWSASGGPWSKVFQTPLDRCHQEKGDVRQRFWLASSSPLLRGLQLNKRGGAEIRALVRHYTGVLHKCQRPNWLSLGGWSIQG